jgi:hypothetical protein
MREGGDEEGQRHGGEEGVEDETLYREQAELLLR